MIRIPFLRYLLERVTSLCFGPSWFARLGGASALTYMVEHYPFQFIRGNLNRIIESLIEVIIGMVDEISSGAVDMAIGALIVLQKRMLTVSFSSLDMRKNDTSYNFNCLFLSFF
uniref:CAS_CSE1 domain-containing protein n=1 Tax=Heterorhabditis bacteriophora TaxID=37862 RepID=A0A1I7X2N4_HETBA